MDISKKCFYCGKYYFMIDRDRENKCPHCGKKENDGLDIFRNMFGDDNPFSNMGGN
jgi:hypothetical protein